MRDPRMILTESKLRLLGAAEALVAERGFDAVSVRDVTNAVKANAAAVNYHFGSREGLLDLLTLRVIEPITEERLARLEILEGKWPAKTAPVEELLDALFRPLLGRSRKLDMPKSRFRKLCGRILSLETSQTAAFIQDQAKITSDRFIKAFKRSLPDLAAEDLGWRLQFATGAMIRLLLSADVNGAAARGASVEAAFGRFIRFATCGLRDGDEGAVDPVAAKGPQAIFDF